MKFDIRNVHSIQNYSRKYIGCEGYFSNYIKNLEYYVTEGVRTICALADIVENDEEEMIFRKNDYAFYRYFYPINRPKDKEMNKKQLIEALEGLDDDAEIFVNVPNEYANLHIIGYRNKVTDDDCRHEITLELEDY